MKLYQTYQELTELDEKFQRYLGDHAPHLAQHLVHYRSNSDPTSSEWIIETARHLDHFIAALFDIQTEVSALMQKTHACDALFADIKKSTRLFHPPKKTDYDNLVSLVPVPEDPYHRLESPTEHHRERDGFSLTDQRMSLDEVMDEIHYCVYCHK